MNDCPTSTQPYMQSGVLSHNNPTQKKKNISIHNNVCSWVWLFLDYAPLWKCKAELNELNLSGRSLGTGYSLKLYPYNNVAVADGQHLWK